MVILLYSKEKKKMSSIILESELVNLSIVQTAESNGRPVCWYRESVDDKFFKYGCDTKICENDLLTPLRKLLKTPTNEMIVILTGGHGRRDGCNYILHSNFIVRDPKLRERYFFEQDLKYCIENRVLIKDMHELSFSELAEYITGKYHVILAFCWSRNDVLLRMLLKLEPVISYVDKIKTHVNEENCTIL